MNSSRESPATERAGDLRRPIAGVAVAVERGRVDVERRVGFAHAALDELVGSGIVARFLAHFVGRRAALDRDLAGVEQRIAFERLADEGLDLEVRQRQQLDRLLELRRHRQRLALSEVEARTQRHRSVSPCRRHYRVKPSPR